MPERFARIEEFNGLGQVLVKFDSQDDGSPEIRFYVNAADYGLGVCSVAIGFKDTESGWDSAERAFENLTTESIRETAERLIQQIKRATGGGDE